MERSDLTAYRCLKCEGAITCRPAELECRSCGAKYPVVAGLADFSENDPNFLSGDSSYDHEMTGILASAREIGWYEALESYERYNSQSRREYATSLSRIDFKFLLPLSKDACVLDIGGGHGLISTVLARSSRHVYTIEKIRAQAEFIALRSNQEGIANLSTACGGSNCRFPYQSDTFDLIIANGVFEWLGFETQFENVERHQQLFLREIARMLKPGGKVWLTTKNKYALTMMFSRGANNNRIPLATLLPDRGFNAVSKFLGKKEYLSCLKSVSGYMSQFDACGLTKSAVWVPLPSVRYPVEFVDFQVGRRLVSPANYRHASLLTRIFHMATPLCLVKRFSLNHAFVLSKKGESPELGRSIVERIVSDRLGITGKQIASLFCPQTSSASSSVIAVVATSKGEHIVKLTRQENDDFLRRETSNLRDLAQLSGAIANVLPKIAAHGEIEGFSYLVLKHCPGVSTWSNRLARGLARRLVKRALTRQVFNFLIELAHKSKTSNSLPFAESVEKPFEQILKSKTSLRPLLEKCQHTLHHHWKHLPLVFAHGDLHVGNFVIGRIAPLQFNILDWESGSKQGFPCCDLLRFAETLRCSAQEITELLNAYCGKLGIHRSLVGPLTILRLVQSWHSWQVQNRMRHALDWSERDRAFDRGIKRVVAQEDLGY